MAFLQIPAKRPLSPPLEPYVRRQVEDVVLGLNRRIVNREAESFSVKNLIHALHGFETGLRLMPNRKDWQPEDTQVETAAMALRAQQMRLWNLVEDSATVGRCWQQTPVWLRCEYRQMASAMLRAVHSHSPDSIRDKRPPSVRQLSEKAADEEEKRIKESLKGQDN